jgi:sigma-B regulation protein RsbU (phosphoserine phosphatase)
LLFDGAVRRLEAGGVVLGLFPNMRYDATSAELAPGTVLAVFTDGVTEAVNGADEEFGEDRLIEALRQTQSRPPEAIYRHVVDQVKKWQGTLAQHDDITLIVAKVE